MAQARPVFEPEDEGGGDGDGAEDDGRVGDGDGGAYVYGVTAALGTAEEEGGRDLQRPEEEFVLLATF